ATRQLAIFVGVPPKPWPRATACAQWVHFDLCCLVEAARRLTALAAHDKIGQIATCSALIKPESLAAIVFGAVNEALPVEIVHVSLGTGSHETSGHHRPVVEPASLVEGF